MWAPRRAEPPRTARPGTSTNRNPHHRGNHNDCPYIYTARNEPQPLVGAPLVGALPTPASSRSGTTTNRLPPNPPSPQRAPNQRNHQNQTHHSSNNPLTAAHPFPILHPKSDAKPKAKAHRPTHDVINIQSTNPTNQPTPSQPGSPRGSGQHGQPQSDPSIAGYRPMLLFSPARHRPVRRVSPPLREGRRLAFGRAA